MADFFKRKLRLGERRQPQATPSRSQPASAGEALPQVTDSRTKLNDGQIILSPHYRNKTASVGLDVVYEPSDPKNGVVDIVFVHGLTGSSYTTWLHGNGVYWPETLLPLEIPDARILTFGYDADVTHFWALASSNTVANHAENMLGALARLREKTDSEERKFIFVAHSLGGLVTKNAMALAAQSPEKHIRDVGVCTIAIAFLGTPHHGADLAAWATTGSRMSKVLKQSNTEILEVLKPRSEVLASVSKAFHDLLRNGKGMNITCFYEEIPLHLVGEVVPKHSAILSGYGSYGIHANHMDMTKFPDCNNSGFMDVSGELRRWVKEIRRDGEKSRKEILESLGFDELHDQLNMLDQHLPSTCDWIWSRNLNAFPAWLGTNSFLFWIPGKPGSGKSTLMRYLAKKFSSDQLPVHLSDGMKDKRKRLTAAYFFDFSSSDFARSLQAAYRALIYQLLVKEPRLLEAVIPVYNQRTAAVKRPRGELEYLLQCIRKIVEFSKGHTFLFLIDGLDESSVESFELAELFARMEEEVHSGLQICAASRPSVAFLDQFRSYPKLIMEENTGSDIHAYVQTRFCQTLKQWSESMDDLASAIVQKSEGVFLWVKLVTEILIRGRRKGEDIGRLRQRLQEFPRDLDKFYQRMLDELDPQDQHESRIMLALVSNAVKPLSPLDLRYAIHFCYGIYAEDLDNPELASRRILAACPGLLEIRLKHKDPFLSNKWRDPEMDTRADGKSEVHLGHETVKSFLSSKKDHLRSRSTDDSYLTGNVLLLKSCIVSLQTYVARVDQEPALQNMQKKEWQEDSTPFLRYSLSWWILHARRAESELLEVPQSLKSLDSHQYDTWRNLSTWALSDLCPDIGNTIRQALSRLHENPVSASEAQLPKTLVELAISVNLRYLANHLLSRNINATSDRLLAAVAMSGNAELAQTLLLHRAMVPGSEYEYNPLCRACLFGHQDVARLLLCHKADPNLSARFWPGLEAANPLQIAVRMANKELVGLLWEFNADFNVLDNRNGTPLAIAAQHGRPDMVKALIGYGAMTNIPGRQTLNSALSAALYSPDADWRPKTIPALLQLGADPNIAPGFSGSPLIWRAVELCDVQAVKSLLDHGAKLNSTCEGSHTVLYQAIRMYKELGDNRFKKMAQLLIEHGGRLTELDRCSLGLDSEECEPELLIQSIERNQKVDDARQEQLRANHALRIQQRNWDLIRLRDTPSPVPNGEYISRSRNTIRAGTQALDRWAGAEDLIHEQIWKKNE